MDWRYDGIVLGAGHNGLVLAAYLARAGVKVVVLERRYEAGGGLATLENPRHCGFFHNTHSFFHRGLTSMPWFDDLELPRRDVRYLEPELNVAMLLEDGRAVEWWTDLERTEASFSGFSPADGLRLRRWVEEFEPIVEKILIPEARSAPLPVQRRQQLLSRTGLGRRLLEVSALSPLEFVEREFEHDTLRAGLLFFNGLREVDPVLRGFGHSIPALLASRARAQMCAGGSARLAAALVGDIREHGGEIRCGVELRAFLLRGGRVSGVELESGERLEAAAFVASSLNPQQTFLELLDEHAVSLQLRRRARKFRYNRLAPLFALHLALSEPPSYQAALQRPELRKAFMVILGLERTSQFRQMIAAHRQGQLPPWVAWGACPTLFDPGQAPEGRHTAFLWQKVPYALGGDPGRWQRESEVHSRRLLELWRQYAPNLEERTIIDRFWQTPLDTERDLPNMRGGDLLVGSFAHGQVGYHRPFPGAGTYRTPVPGLYLCGGSTHPGGNITGLCGYNAAAVVAEDLGIEPWWRPHQVEDAWSRI